MDSAVTTSTENSTRVVAFAPAALAIVSIVLGLFAPFFGLPVAMVSVVLFSASPIRDRRWRLVTIGLVIIAVVLNLTMVMMSLPAGGELVEGETFAPR
jgi:hypothetical protein